MFNLLPLLKGWEYKGHVAERMAVVRGADPIEILRLSETGWIFQILEFTTDIYGTLLIEFQGAELATRTFTIYPEAYRGAWAHDPSGWAQVYFRPNPDSTAGIYSIGALGGGTQGSLFPYVPSVVLKLYLPEESTQETAYIWGGAGVVAITDKRAFIRSLRRVLDAKASLKIDDALLTTGPAVFKEVKE